MTAVVFHVNALDAQIAAFDLGRLTGRAEMVALVAPACLLSQEGQLLGGFHPFGNGMQAHGAGQRNDGAYDALILSVLVHPLDEAHIDLDGIDGEVA
ncbi:MULTISPECIES: hypothetical protein [Halomonadaceae]|uniref:hypothetical protein n=1 Tax=Halomonas sp. MCCC 1A11057 TaxID=2733482 RepID=UPI001F358F96|nr:MULTISPECIES: hypothetical protein [Halomonas]